MLHIIIRSGVSLSLTIPWFVFFHPTMNLELLLGWKFVLHSFAWFCLSFGILTKASGETFHNRKIRVNGETEHRRTHKNKWHMSAYVITECNMVQMPSCALSWSEHAYTADTDITRENQQYRYDNNCLFRCIHLNINHIQIIFIKISGWLSHLYFLLACVNISIWSVWNVGIECPHSEMWDNKKADPNR